MTTLKGLSGIIKSGKILPRAYRERKSGDTKSLPSGNFGRELNQYSRGRIHLTSDIEHWSNMVMDSSGKNIILRISPRHISKYKVRSSYHAMRHRDRFQDDDDTLRGMYDYDPSEIGRDLFVTTPIPIKHLDIYNLHEDGWDPLDHNILHDDNISDYVNYA